MRRVLLVFLITAGAGHRVEAGPREDSYLKRLITNAREQRLADDPQWWALLHYRKRLLRGVRSDADGKDFFLSQRGKKGPSAELEATLRAFFAPEVIEDGKQHPQCRFPARYSWLKERLAFDSSSLIEYRCLRFEAWRGDPESVTVIYADAYLDNSASMYGHTFLRLNRRGRPDKQRLLDYAVNFSADTDETNGLVFAVKGIFGLYRGQFSVRPFYMQVQKYNNLESRDLWEFRLGLTPEAMDRLMKHLWELGSTHFAYWFFSENCSYQLLPLLHAADPSLGLGTWSRIAVIPIDTIRRFVSVPGLVVDTRYRPSAFSKLLQRRSRLTRDEVRIATLIGRHPSEESLKRLAPLIAERQAAVLDSAFDLFRYRNGFKLEFEAPIDEQERTLLLHRAQLKDVGKAEDWTTPPRPETGHKSARLGLQSGLHRDAPFGELALRGALHDELADQTGYIPNSLLEMWDFRVRFEKEHPLYLQEAQFIDIVSLTPLDRWVRKPSWEVAFGFHQAEELGCRGNKCLLFDLVGGYGLSLSPQWPGEPLFYALAEVETAAGDELEYNHRLGGGVSTGMMMGGPWGRLSFKFTHRRYALGDDTRNTAYRLGWAYPLRKNLEARGRLLKHDPHREASLLLNLYF